MKKDVADCSKSIRYCLFRPHVIVFPMLMRYRVLRRVTELTKNVSVNTERCDQVKGADESRESQRLLSVRTPSLAV